MLQERRALLKGVMARRLCAVASAAMFVVATTPHPTPQRPSVESARSAKGTVVGAGVRGTQTPPLQPPSRGWTRGQPRVVTFEVPSQVAGEIPSRGRTQHAPGPEATVCSTPGPLCHTQSPQGRCAPHGMGGVCEEVTACDTEDRPDRRRVLAAPDFVGRRVLALGASSAALFA